MATGFVNVSQGHLNNPVGISVLLKIISMDKNIDQLLVKVSGRMFLGQRLEIDQDVTLVLKGSITKEEILSNQDGSVNICAVFKATEAEVQL
jgi:hypothetical protein